MKFSTNYPKVKDIADAHRILPLIRSNLKKRKAYQSACQIEILVHMYVALTLITITRLMLSDRACSFLLTSVTTHKCNSNETCLMPRNIPHLKGKLMTSTSKVWKLIGLKDAVGFDYTRETPELISTGTMS